MKKLLNNRYINSVLLIINLISSAFTIWSFWHSLFDQKTFIALFSVSTFGFAFAIAYFVSQAFMPTVDKAIVVADNFHNIIDIYKDLTLELRDSFERTESASEYEKFRVTEVRKIFLKYNDLLRDSGINRPRISFKLFCPDCNNTLYTFCRDNSLSENRIIKDHMERIPVEACTSFNGIMNLNYEKYFVGNNLVKDYKKKKYFDYRGKPKYSSALVVPVRALRVAGETKGTYYDVIGFICISSKEKNQFLENKPITKIIIECTRAFADCMYTLITGTQLYCETLSNLEVVHD